MMQRHTKIRQTLPYTVRKKSPKTLIVKDFIPYYGLIHNKFKKHS